MGHLYEFFLVYMVVVLTFLQPSIQNTSPYCDSMVPVNSIITSAATTTAPYTIQFQGNCYNTNNNILVTVSGDADQIRFVGFIVQAFSVTMNQGLQGAFANADYENVIVDCPPHEQSVIVNSHMPPEVAAIGIMSTDFYWQASSNIGDVQFRGTIVSPNGTFWMNVLSPVLMLCEDGQPLLIYPAPSSSTKQSVPISHVLASLALLLGTLRLLD